MKKSIPFLFLSLFLLFACSEPVKKNEADFYVRGNCGMCKERIEGAASGVQGVEKAEWDVKTKNLHLSYDSTKVTVAEVKKIVANVGHETKDIQSPAAVHDSLPECCKKGGIM